MAPAKHSNLPNLDIRTHRKAVPKSHATLGPEEPQKPDLKNPLPFPCLDRIPDKQSGQTARLANG